MNILEHNISEKAITFSTKRGSTDGPYAGFNITDYCGDSLQHVAECRKQLCAHLKIADSNLILPRQTHSINTLHIDKEFLQKSPDEQKSLLQGVDALITTLPGVCIGVSTADCVPVLLLDEAQSIVAAIHAGWRGTVGGITKKSVTEIMEKYGSSATNIKAIIAPSIGCEAFEVGDEVYEAFEKAGFPMEKIATRKEKWHIDLWEANKLQLTACGVPHKNITVAGICTHTRHNEFFSARRLGINSGRIFNGIMIK